MPWNLILSPGKALEKFDFVRIQSFFVSEVHCNHLNIYKIMKHPWKIGHFCPGKLPFYPGNSPGKALEIVSSGKVGTLYLDYKKALTAFLMRDFCCCCLHI